MIEPLFPNTGALVAHDGPGSKDGQGAGDHDQPYRLGRRPSSTTPFPFTMRQFARLLILRGEIQARCA